MKKKSAQNSQKSGNTTPANKKKRRVLKIIAIIFGALALFAVGYYSQDARIKSLLSQRALATKQKTASRHAARLDYRPLIGRWQRNGGDDILEIRSVATDGRMDAAFYNPDPIPIARAEAATQGDVLGLFVELQDKGSPQATYKLLYYPAQNALAGLYDQPAASGSIEVIFTKQK